MSKPDQNHTKYLKSLNLITKKNIAAAAVAAKEVISAAMNSVRPAHPAKDYLVAMKAMVGIKLDHIEPSIFSPF